MLTKDLLRFKIADGKALPSLVKPTPAILSLAANLLGHWNGGVGQRLDDLEDGAVPILHQTRSLLIAKGFQKLIVDACTFAEAPSAGELRARAFAASAARLRAPLASEADHRAQVAAEVGLSGNDLAEQLYADLPGFARLTVPSDLTPDSLIAQYNLAQCQGLLLTARELTVTVHDTDAGVRRRLLKALRWCRLLADVAGDEGKALTLVISGPGSVLDQASRYGLNLALFLPVLASCRRWEATAWVRPGQERIDHELVLTEELGLRGDTRYLAHIPQEVAHLTQALAEAWPEAHVGEAPLLPLGGGELAVPDLEVRVGGRAIAVELFHRWHEATLDRRLKRLATPGLPLVIGVDRALAKRRPGLADHPVMARQGFLFSDLPTAKAVRKAVEGLASV